MPLLATDAPAEVYLRRHYRWNFVVNVMDGVFFTLGATFASSVAVLPLFVHNLTDSTLLIGLTATIPRLCWLLPQLLTAWYVLRLSRNKPFVLLTSSMERFQWWVLVPVVLAVEQIGRTDTLTLFFVLYVWWALGGGFTGTAWQDMIAKIIPAKRRGLFFGLHGLLGGTLAAGGTVVAGYILQHLPYPTNFALCFFLAGGCFVVSYIFLALTREPAILRPAPPMAGLSRYLGELGCILKTNRSYTALLIGRSLSILSAMPLAFMAMYAMTRFSTTIQEVGWLAAVLVAAQTLGELGWGILGDRRSHRSVLGHATLMGGMACIVAVLAPSVGWMYLVFGLLGLALGGTTVAGINTVLELAPDAERPTYIGLTSTLMAVPTGLAPLLGSWVVVQWGYPVLFMFAMGLAVASYTLLRQPTAVPARSWPALSRKEIIHE